MTGLEFGLLSVSVVVIVLGLLIESAKGRDVADDVRARRRLLDEVQRHGGSS